MNNFIVSARKYRPATFQSVVGQNSVTSTLKNAISTGHLAHAYLFCGPRGVGKTTCARIFAKTLNCFSRTADTEACNQCESCQSFNQSRSYSIHELDAASNNSVEDIRNLIDQVRIPPQVGKYSIYIIDEVHMLSNQAFNAFLKTLEEPPAHAFFILATTEKHKIIPTILSRCQIFDFNRIRIEDTIQYLEYISKTEGVKYEVDALNMIAQKADGGMRDALSIYDQIVSFSGDNITYQNVIENLNILDYEYYFRMVDAFLEKNLSNALLLFNEILEKGFDGHNFINGLASHLRDVLVCKDEATLKLLEVGATVLEKYKQQSRKCPAAFLFEALSICSNCDQQYKASKNQRLHVELGLIQICNIDLEKKNNPLNPDSKSTNDLKSTSSTTNLGKSSIPIDSKSPANNSKPQPVNIPSFSIKEALIKANASIISDEKSKGIESENSSLTDGRNLKFKSFTQEDLNKVWQKLTKSYETDQPRVYSAMAAQYPILKDKSEIEILLSNKLQEEEMQKMLTAIQSELKALLENDSILVVTRVPEAEEMEKKFYSDKEKFDHLAQKNPSLLNFKQQFGLDFG